MRPGSFPTEGIVLGVMDAAVALAGLLLVFIGFLLARADQTTLQSRRVKVKRVAIGGLVPFVACLACVLQSIWAVQGAHLSATLLLGSFKIVLAFTAVYAIIATFYEVK